MEKLLTIIVPSYNVESFLDDVLKTYIIPEAFPLFEVIVVNDGSVDRTQEIAESYQQRYPECFVVINKENGGHGSTINTGIRHARGKYIRVIDGDDWVDSACLKNYLEKLKGLDADLILSPFNRVGNDGSLLKAYSLPQGCPECTALSALEGLKWFNDLYRMHAIAVKTEILRQIPAISEHCFYVDIEFISFPLKFIKTIAFINETVYQYRFGLEGQSVSQSSMQRNRAQHYHVIVRVLSYFADCLGNPPFAYIHPSLIRMVNTQFEIYLSMPISPTVHKEMSAYTDSLKREAPWIVSEIPYWKYQLLLRNNSYPVYCFAAILTQLRMKQLIRHAD